VTRRERVTLVIFCVVLHAVFFISFFGTRVDVFLGERVLLVRSLWFSREAWMFTS
jgi:hypothetical protein